MATATPAAGNDDLITAASAILDRNWTGAYTVPATGLYPHQWSWDSGFIAMGLRHVRPLRAQQELESPLSAQWLDGRLPQIVYDDKRDDDYSPGAAFWRSSEISGTPQRPTAGLIQPPRTHCGRSRSWPWATSPSTSVRTRRPIGTGRES